MELSNVLISLAGLHGIIIFFVSVAVKESLTLSSGGKATYIILTIFLPLFGAAIAYEKANMPPIKKGRIKKHNSIVDNPGNYEYHNSGSGIDGGSSD